MDVTLTPDDVLLHLIFLFIFITHLGIFLSGWSPSVHPCGPAALLSNPATPLSTASAAVDICTACTASAATGHGHAEGAADGLPSHDGGGTASASLCTPDPHEPGTSSTTRPP